MVGRNSPLSLILSTSYLTTDTGNFHNIFQCYKIHGRVTDLVKYTLRLSVSVFIQMDAVLYKFYLLIKISFVSNNKLLRGLGYRASMKIFPVKYKERNTYNSQSFIFFIGNSMSYFTIFFYQYCPYVVPKVNM
jgi:hypothetical protein